MSETKTRDEERLRAEIARLGPWHMDVAVTPDLSTKTFLEADTEEYEGDRDATKVSFVNQRFGTFDAMMKTLYPQGLEGRSFMECASNCAAYCFWAKEMGAGRCFGFDVHDHWIEQARFLAEARDPTWTSAEMSFEVLDLYDLPDLDLEPFDITWFSGILYHLPDPFSGLKLAADLTNELILVDTAFKNDLPDGMLSIAFEGTEHVMTGVYGLNWFPTGPEVVQEMLGAAGFVDTEVIHVRRERATRRGDIGRLRVVGSRKPGLLDPLRERGWRRRAAAAAEETA